MKQPIMSTKANTLLSLQPIVTKSEIEDMLVVTVGNFLSGRLGVYHKVAERFKGDTVVVRSSSTFEDGIAYSKAGRFESILDVDSSDSDAVCSAIAKVMESYIGGEATGERMKELEDEQILIQRQTRDVVMSGVVFTRDLIYNRPYYMLTYDVDGRTDSVTGGRSGKTKWIAKNVSREFLEERFLKLIQAVRELEKFYSNIEALDIEFAINKDEQVILFQVRPLVAVIDQPHMLSDRELRDTKAFAKCSYLDTGHMLSESAYWNPLKYLGMNPRPLDCSLYKELITSRAWSDGVRTLGYGHVTEDLMQKIGNKPYVSLDYAFDGLTPQGLDERLQFKLFSYYKDELRKNRGVHVNLESKIVFHAFDFMTDKRLSALANKGFTKEEIRQIRDVLFASTSRILSDYPAICVNDMTSIEQLSRFRHILRAGTLFQDTNVMKIYKYIEDMMENLTRYGTTQYARQTGCAFIARNLCASLVEAGYFTEEEMSTFQNSIPSIMAQYERDYDRYMHGEMDKKEFDEMYGHLRAGIYDIRSECYKHVAKEPETRVPHEADEKEDIFKYVRYPERKRLARAISDIGLPVTVDEMYDFIVEAIMNEAFFQFEYSKSLGLILDIITRLGDLLGIAREDMSYLEIPDLLSYHSRDSYIQIIESRRDMYHANTYLVLPDTIYDVGDIDIIDVDDSKPNFITNRQVTAQVVDLDSDGQADITGKIVLMREANPEYIWIFQKNIAGFISEYGGATSHMALCCAEYNIPAAIGCGDRIYAEALHKQYITLDCTNGKIR